MLVHFARQRKEVPFRQLFWLFGAFIVFCGSTHLMDVITLHYPAYRLLGLMKLGTALVSWATVFAIIPVTPRALAMKFPEELEREVEERKRAEEALRKLNAELEERVKERTRLATQRAEELARAKEEAERANSVKSEFLAVMSHELRMECDLSALTVLVVEDNPINRRVVTTQLEKLQAGEVVVAEDGQMALALLSERTVDLILLDCQMPGLDGFEVARLIRSDADRFGRPIIIALTAHALSEERQRCLDVGMDDFLSKPLSFKSLRATLKVWSERL